MVSQLRCDCLIAVGERSPFWGRPRSCGSCCARGPPSACPCSGPAGAATGQGAGRVTGAVTGGGTGTGTGTRTGSGPGIETGARAGAGVGPKALDCRGRRRPCCSCNPQRCRSGATHASRGRLRAQCRGEEPVVVARRLKKARSSGQLLETSHSLLQGIGEDLTLPCSFPTEGSAQQGQRLQGCTMEARGESGSRLAHCPKSCPGSPRAHWDGAGEAGPCSPPGVPLGLRADGPHSSRSTSSSGSNASNWDLNNGASWNWRGRGGRGAGQQKERIWNHPCVQVKYE